MTEIYKTTNKMISNVRILYNSFERNVAEATITEKKAAFKSLSARKKRHGNFSYTTSLIAFWKFSLPKSTARNNCL